MKITNLRLINFRSYDSVDIKINSNINIIYGNNGVGKTNFVEGIYLLALTKSFRINNEKYLIKKGTDQAQIIGEVLKNNDLSTYKVYLSQEGKKVELNNNKVDKISDYISRIMVVTYYPHDNEIINASPDIRRKMLNIEISQLYREYVVVLNKYNKILKQRNAYLKQLYVYGNASKDYLDILTKKLIEHGKAINKYRKEFIDNINKYIIDIYKNIFNDGVLVVKYKSDYHKNEKDILDFYRKNYSKEMAFGKTLFGPHHDDIEFILDKNRLKEWGSQGQMKNAIISFKLAEIKLIYELKNDYPILILDDLFSELDKIKINNILKLLDENVQTFITTTELDNVSKDILKNASIFKVLLNQIEEVDYE